MATQDISQLVVEVKSKGIQEATDQLTKLATASDKAEGAVKKLGTNVVNSGEQVSGSAKAMAASSSTASRAVQELTEAFKQKEIQQKRDIELHNQQGRAYAAANAEALKINAALDRQAAGYAKAHEEALKMNAELDRRKSSAAQDAQEAAAAQAAAEALRIKAIQQKRDVELHAQQAAAYAATHAEALRINADYDRQAVAATRATAAVVVNGEAMAEAHALARGLSGSLGALWVTYGNLAGMGVGIALGASLKGVIEVGKDVENTLEGIRVLGGATTTEITQMSAAINDLGKGAQGPRDVAEALKVLTLAGLNANEAMKGVTAALNLSQGGEVSVEKSAETLVQVGTALGYTADAYEHVADVITKAAAASMTSVDSISGAFKSAAAVGATYGASLQDIALGLSAVANLGIQGTSAGTALKNFYKDLSASTSKVTTTLGAMKMSISDFRGSDGFFLPLIDVVKKLDGGLSTLSAKARALAEVRIFGQQGLREGAILLEMLHQESDAVDEHGKHLSKLEKLYRDIGDAAAFSNLAAIAMGQTTSSQMKAVGSTIQTSFAEVFKSIAPQIGEISRSLRQAFAGEDFKSGIKTVMQLIADFTKVVIDNVGVLKTLGEVLIGVKMLQFANDARLALMAMQPIALTVRGILSSLGPLAIAITGLTLAWQWYKEAKDKALDNKPAEANLSEYAERVQKEAEKEKALLELRKKGYSDVEAARQAQMQEDAAAADKAKKDAMDGVRAIEAQQNKLWSSMSESAKQLANSLLQTQGPAFDGMVKRLESTPGAHGVSMIGQAVEYAKAEKAHQAALASTTTLIQKATVAEKEFRAAREARGKLDDADAKKRTLIVGNGDVELPGKTTSDADQYAAALAKHQGEIKAAYQELANYRAQEDADFKSGQIGKLKLIDDVANKEVETYKRVAAEAKANMEIAAGHRDKNGNADKAADVERFKDQMDRANESISQADKMRVANTLAAERDMQTQITSLKIKSLEDQGKFVEAANLKWSADNRTTWMQAAADAAATGNDVAKQFLIAQNAIKQTAFNVATVKEDSAEFNNAILGAENTLKGFKTATFGVSIDTMFDKALKASKDFDKEIEEAKTKRDQLMIDAYASNFSPDSMKALEQANQQVAAATDKQKTMWEGVGQTITDSLTKAFGTAGTAMGELYKSSIKFSQNENMSASDRIKNYGDMAQSAAGFFDKQSKGYRALNGLSQMFHVAEMARTLARTVAYIAEGAANMFGQGGFLGFAGVAAMGAVMAGLGFAMSGAHGADPSLDASAVQKAQGTGTVFGDATAKSDSISKSLDTLKSNSDMMLPLTQGMLSSLQKIEAAMTGLANLVVRSGSADGSNFNVKEGTVSKGFLGNGAFGNLMNSGAGWIVSPVLKLVNALWGKTTQTLIDSGLTFGGKVSDLQKGQGFNQYATTKTDSSSFFGLVKNSSTNVQTQGVSDELSSQFGLVFSGLEDALKGAASSLGSSSDAVGKAIENLVLDTTKVSLKDLKGQDLTNAIDNVLSGAMDQIAKAAYPQMQAFQQVGEGYAQTVIRVATGVEQADAALKKLNVQALGYLDIANKTGDVAYEIAKQSIALKEGSSGVGEIMSQISGTMSDVVTAYTDLVAARKQMQKTGLGSGLNFDTLSGAGDLKSLTSDLTTYYDKYFTASEKAAMDTKDLTEQFNTFGYDLPNTREQLRKWIEAAASVGDQVKVGQLLSLASAFDTLATSLGKIDPFSDDAVKAAKQSYDDAVSAAEKAYTRLETAVNKEKKPIQDAMTALTTVVDNVKSNMESLAEAMNATVKPTLSFEQSMKTVREAIATLHSGGDITKVAGLSGAVKNVASVSDTGYSTLLDFQRAQAEAYNALDDLNNAGQDTLDVEQAQLDRLDDILSTARNQLDALQGIDNSVLSVAGALANFGSAMQTATVAKTNYTAVSAGNTGGGASAAIDALYSSVLGRSADAAGKAFWMDKVNSGVSMSAITQAFYDSSEHQSSIPSFDVGTNSVPEDMLAKVHKGERIIPAADNAELQRKLDATAAKETSNASDDDLKASVAELSDSVKRGDVATVQKFNDLYKLMLRWETNGMPSTRNDTTS